MAFRNLSSFYIAAVRHLEFLEIQIFNCRYCFCRVNMRQRIKFGGGRSNRYRDMAVFRFFKISAVRHLGFV